MESTAADTRIRDWLALAFASFFPLVMSALSFLVLNTGEPNAAILTAIGTGKVLQIAFPALYVFWFERERLRLAAPTWRGIPLGLGFALVVGTSMFGLYYLLVQDLPGVRDNTPTMIFQRLQEFGATTPPTYFILGFVICVPHALMEEYYWRWFVFGTMRRHVSLPIAIVLSSLGFMLHHIVILGVYFPGNFWLLAMPFSFCVAIGGGVWAWIYERSGSLYGPWLSHCLIDAAILGVGFWMLWDKWT